MRLYMMTMALGMRLMRPDGDGQGGGGTPPADKSKEQSTPPTDPAASEGEGDFDDYGYPIVKDEGDPPKEAAGKPKSEPPKADDKIENPATGYGVEPPKVDDPTPPVTPPATPPADPPTVDLGFEVNDDGIPKEESAKLKEFLKKHGASKELAQALLDQRKSELQSAEASRVQAEQEAKAQKSRVEAQWHKELKDDPTFGGEKFAHNILRAEKVVEEFMPDLKKRLTETKAMLPPYVMRGLANVGNHLYETPSLVQGDPVNANPEDAKGEDDPLAFYNS